MSQKILDYDLVGICKRKVTLSFTKPAYAGMCIVDSSKGFIRSFVMITLNRNIEKNRNY